MFFICRKSEDETIRFLFESGASVTQIGWIEVDKETFFGSPLELALFIHKKSNGSESSEKLFKIVWTEREKQIKNVETECEYLSF